MKNGWGSFQKQLCNYGFEKQNRNKNQALYVHWDNKFCSGRPDLLSQVKRRPKDLVQEQPPAPNTPPAPQPLGPLNPDARIEFLENQLEITQKKVSELERLLQEMGTLVKQISSKLDAALSIRNDSPNSQVHTGLVEGAVGNQYSMAEGGPPSSVHDGFAPEPSTGAYDDGAQLRGLPSHMGPGAPLTTIDPALLQLPIRHQLHAHHQLPDNTTSFAGSSRTPHYAAGLSAVPVPFLMQHSSTYGAGPTSLSSYAQQQNAGPSTGAPTFPPNGFVPAPTSQAQVRPQSSNSPRTLSGQKRFGGLCPVPRPSPPGPSRSGHFPFGSTNAGY